MNPIRTALLGVALLAGCASGGDAPGMARQAEAPGVVEAPPNAFLAAPSASSPDAPPALPALPPPPPVSLLAGDLIFLSVFRQRELDLEVRIPESGSFSFPLIGEVRAAGRPLKEVEADVRSRLEEKYLKRAGVTLTVREFAPRLVYVLGGVAKPAGYEYPLSRRLTVLQLVSTAGGFTDRAQKEYAQLLRRKENGERQIVRFSVAEVERAVARGRADADLELAPDDLLVIPSAARVVYVLGQVNKPGAFELPADTRTTLSMAVSQAGSWTKFASIGRIQVLRQPPTGEPLRFTVDLDQVVNGRIDLDLELHPGDVVWVPQRSLF